MPTRQEIRDRLRARTTEIPCAALDGAAVKIRKLSAFALLDIDERCGGSRPAGKQAGALMGFVVAQSVIDDNGGFVYESAEQAVHELELPVLQELCDKALDFNGLFQKEGSGVRDQGSGVRDQGSGEEEGDAAKKN